VRFGAALFLLMAAVSPSDVAGQTLAGRTVEEGRNVPVPGALVFLVDRDGKHRAEARSDSLGRFWLTPPEAGAYQVEARRFGYETTRSPLLALKAEGHVAVDLTMRPAPIGLAGIEVSVERQAEDLLGRFGLTPARLGDRWIDHDAIAKMPLLTGPGEVITQRGIAGLGVDDCGATTVKCDLCVHFFRANTGIGLKTCALLVLNGVAVPPDVAEFLDPLDLEAIAVLKPEDATTFYGERGVGGVVLMWTRSGRR
jgi:Carboxypeptidase regulatory-like domain